MTPERKAALDAELRGLNAAVDAALASRKQWMDAHMPDYGQMQVGDEIYDLDTGRRLGVVSRLYRYHAGRNPLFDTSMSISYEYEMSPRCFDNTSRQPALIFGGEKDITHRKGKVL